MDIQNKLASHLQAIPRSGIRDFFELVIGRDDVISLGVGEPDFVTLVDVPGGAGKISYGRYLTDRFPDPVTDFDFDGHRDVACHGSIHAVVVLGGYGNDRQ